MPIEKIRIRTNGTEEIFTIGENGVESIGLNKNERIIIIKYDDGAEWSRTNIFFENIEKIDFSFTKS